MLHPYYDVQKYEKWSELPYLINLLFIKYGSSDPSSYVYLNMSEHMCIVFVAYKVSESTTLQTALFTEACYNGADALSHLLFRREATHTCDSSSQTKINLLSVS